MSSTRLNIRGILINLCVLTVTLLLFAVAMEVFLRVSGIQPMNTRLAKLHQPSPVPGLVYELLPNLTDQPGYGSETLRTNSLGFRGAEPDLKKTVIAMLGDSYTMGFGVNDDQTNPYYLSKQFSQYSVINAGVNGYNIEQETLQYEAKIRKLDPRLVILQFVFNDAAPKGHFNNEGFIVTGPTDESGTVVESTPVTLKSIKESLYTHSALIRFLERTTKQLPFRSHSDVDTAEWKPEELKFYELWFNRLSRSIGNRPRLFVIWPEVWLHAKTRAELKVMAERRGWTMLDLYDIYGNTYQSLGWDFHPTPAMHERVAGVMAEYVRDLLPWGR